MSSAPAPPAPVKLFLHVCAVNNAERIVSEIIAAVHMSGLYRELSAAYVYICGDAAMIPAVSARVLRSGAKFSVVKTAPGDTTYERLTLTDMHRHVAPDDHVLYLHSKGVTQVGTPREAPVADWVYALLYHLVGRHRECREKLAAGAQTVGMNYRGGKKPHWNGNMQWVRGDYFLTLPTTIGPDYYAPEQEFLFLNNPSYHEIYGSVNVQHYEKLYPPSKYVDRT